MSLQGKQIGFALPEGHFLMPAILDELKKMIAAGADVYPLFLAVSDCPDYDEQFIATKKILEEITGKELLNASMAEATDGAKEKEISFDMMVVAPCPGNLLAKLVNARAMAAPLSRTIRHLQRGRPVVLALVSNGDSEGLMQNVQQIINIKTIFLVPFGPRQQGEKQVFLARLDLLYETVIYALAQRQLQPVYLEPFWLPH